MKAEDIEGRMNDAINLREASPTRISTRKAITKPRISMMGHFGLTSALECVKPQRRNVIGAVKASV